MLTCTGCGNFESQCSCIDMIGQPVNNNQELDARNLEFVTYHADSENVLNMINRLRENIVEDNSNLPENLTILDESNNPYRKEILNFYLENNIRDILSLENKNNFFKRSTSNFGNIKNEFLNENINSIVLPIGINSETKELITLNFVDSNALAIYGENTVTAKMKIKDILLALALNSTQKDFKFKVIDHKNELFTMSELFLLNLNQVSNYKNDLYLFKKYLTEIASSINYNLTRVRASNFSNFEEFRRNNTNNSEPFQIIFINELDVLLQDLKREAEENDAYDEFVDLVKLLIDCIVRSKFSGVKFIYTVNNIVDMLENYFEILTLTDVKIFKGSNVSELHSFIYNFENLTDFNSDYAYIYKEPNNLTPFIDLPILEEESIKLIQNMVASQDSLNVRKSSLDILISPTTRTNDILTTRDINTNQTIIGGRPFGTDPLDRIIRREDSDILDGDIDDTFDDFDEYYRTYEQDTRQSDNQELNIEPTEEEILNSAYRQLSNELLNDVADFTDD